MKARGVPNGVGVSLARNRRSPKHPSEPRLSGVHPMEAEVGKGRRSLPLKSAGCLLGIESEHTGGTHGDSQSSARGIFDGPTVSRFMPDR